MAEIQQTEEPDSVAPSAPEADAPTVVAVDVLVEDVSIDGMCGVY